MNQIYKVIWSKVRHCHVVVSELAKKTVILYQLARELAQK